MFYKFDNTCISWRLIYYSDIISISGNTMIFLKITESNSHVHLLKIDFDTNEMAKIALHDLHNTIVSRSDNIQDLSNKVNEMYYMPNMPGFLQAKQSFDNISR